MNSIKAPKVMNSNESISDIDEEDFLLIKYNTLKHLKLDLFVAADNPLHDSLEALKGDIVPARGAIASAKNIGDLQIALYQMRAKMKAMEDIAKKDKIHSVGEYIKTVAHKIGLYEDPKDYLKKQREHYAKQRNLEAIKFKEVAARQEVERQLEKDKKPEVSLLEAAKAVSVMIGVVDKKVKEYKRKVAGAIEGFDGKSFKEKLEELRGYDNAKWLGVGSPLNIGGREYEFIKGQATQLISKFSLESVGVNPGDDMAPRDMLSFLNSSNSVLGLIGQSVGVKESTVGLDGKVAVWANALGVGGAEASLNNEGGSILRLSEGVTAGDAVSAWTHSFVNYSLPGSISSLVDDVEMSAILSSPSVVPVSSVAASDVEGVAKATPAGLSNELVEGVDKPAVSFAMTSSKAIKDVAYVSSVSGFTIAAAKAVMSGAQDNIEALKAGMDDIARDSFFKALMGDDYLKLSDVERKGLSSAEMTVAVKDYVTGRSKDIDLIGVLYKNDLLDLPGLGEGIDSKLKKPSVELSGVMQTLKMGYGDINQVLKSAKEEYPTQVLDRIADMKGGVIKVDNINPATVELLGRYVEKRLFPNVNGLESGVRVTKNLEDTQFAPNMDRVLNAVVGANNRVGPVRALTQEQINEKAVDLSKGIAELLSKVNSDMASVKPERKINLDLTAGVKLEAQVESIRDSIASKLGDSLTVGQREQLMRATESEVSKLMSLKEKKPTPDEGLKMNNELIRENREKMAQERTELSAETKAKKAREEEENNPFLKKMRAPSPTDMFDI